jgi:hypothetical protein
MSLPQGSHHLLANTEHVFRGWKERQPHDQTEYNISTSLDITREWKQWSGLLGSVLTQMEKLHTPMLPVAPGKR